MKVRNAVGAGFVALACVLATPAISAGSAAQAKPLPVVSIKEARKVVRDFVDADVSAAETNSVAALEGFTTGLAREIETGIFAQAAAEGEPAFESYKSKVSKVFTVRTTSYPRHFLALVEDDEGGGSTDKTVSLFVQESKGDPWLWERSIADPDTGWPKFAVDKDGYVRTDVQASKLFLDPETVPTELATYLTMPSALATASNPDSFGSSDGTDGYRKDTRDDLEGFDDDGYSASFTATVSPHDVFVFRLKDGSALVSFGLSSAFRVSHPDANPDQALEQDADRSSYDARIAPGLYREFVDNALEDFTVIVPTKKSKDKPIATTVFYGPTSSTATPVADPSQYT